MSELCELVITAPDPDWLHRFSRQLVIDGLAASVHDFGEVRSIYKWKGEVFERSEGRVAIHTRRALVAIIDERASGSHPYQVPSLSARPIYDGSRQYLEWILEQTRDV